MLFPNRKGSVRPQRLNKSCPTALRVFEDRATFLYCKLAVSMTLIG